MKVFATTRFDKEIKKQLSAVQEEQLDVFIIRLKKNKQRGKPLRGKWLYEVKLRGKRAYYVVSGNKALFVGVSGKKDQDITIKGIVKRKQEFTSILDNTTSFKVF